MAKQRKKRPPDSGPSEDWIVTFSDCMMLLLCFFVMLLSFSSFDESSLQQLGGVILMPSNFSVSDDSDDTSKPTFVKPIDRPMDVTTVGSEIYSDAEQKRIKNPKKYEQVLDEDAYKDRRVFSLRRSDLFWAKGATVTAKGRKKLKKIAAFLKVLPCRVVISLRGDNDLELGLKRSVAVMRYFTQPGKGGADANLFSVAAGSGSDEKKFDGEPYIELALLSGKALR